jgi:hypothetical protein
MLLSSLAHKPFKKELAQTIVTQVNRHLKISRIYIEVIFEEEVQKDKGLATKIMEPNINGKP